ncbi:TonB-dependent receptor [Sphingobacterium sp. E70]|uniref:TonB-dependent receptor domain-containing protein n=1 Tax=Sphingobacterium sp. E70 TaxID=2853439 RepID=UPI00211BDE8E|nr:TonB-dependent receptor [Sphingobacterium sp. E70]ULT24201.1 TonB-dependent receptor [Sphingobacterium sp. E70]
MADGSFPYAEVSANMVGLYVQDAFAVNNNFKLTAGLRADYTHLSSPSNLKNDNVSKLTFDQGEKIDVSKYPKGTILWSPRIGFNWNVNGTNQTQIRGGQGSLPVVRHWYGSPTKLATMVLCLALKQ